ncbi:MAG: zf-TFIIB domain-containing protein [bacterium]
MNCPVCDEPMIVLELSEVEIDHCLECGGIWLDEGELEVLLGSSEEKDNMLKSLTGSEEIKEDPRKCPICLKKMGKVLCGVDKKVCIDKCDRNDGIWFDKGELDEVIKMGGLDKNRKVLDLLEDMFGKKKNN